MVWYIAIVLYFWELLKTWLTTLFVIPFKNPEVLWLLIPVWLSWFFAEFFQEKEHTSMGNAISNAVVLLWGGVDWTRQTVNFITAGTIQGIGTIIIRFAMTAVGFGYGIFIIVLGIKGNKLIEYMGRIREVTYFFAMFTPIFYNVIPFSFNHLFAAILFFPLFYYAIEIIDRYTPNPKSILEDEGKL